jgi:hypothetical protein
MNAFHDCCWQLPLLTIYGCHRSYAIVCWTGQGSRVCCLLPQLCCIHPPHSHTYRINKGTRCFFCMWVCEGPKAGTRSRSSSNSSHILSSAICTLPQLGQRFVMAIYSFICHLEACPGSCSVVLLFLVRLCHELVICLSADALSQEQNRTGETCSIENSCAGCS